MRLLINDVLDEINTKTFRHKFKLSSQRLYQWRKRGVIPTAWLLVLFKEYPNLNAWEIHKAELKELNIV